MLAKTWKINGILSMGNRNPESRAVGRNNPIIVIIIASICVFTIAEMAMPNEAAVSMKMMHRSKSSQMLPLIGILNTKTLIIRMMMVDMKDRII